MLVGAIAFLLGMTLLIWSATGLAGLVAHGAWPTGVTFAQTPFAMRHLLGHPHDLPGAWPHTPSGQLTGYGFLWGMFVAQLAALVVLFLVVVSAVARWRARRAVRRAESRRAKADAMARPGPAEPRPPSGHHDRPLPTPRTPGPAAHERPAAQDSHVPGNPRLWDSADHPVKAAPSRDVPTEDVLQQGMVGQGTPTRVPSSVPASAGTDDVRFAAGTAQDPYRDVDPDRSSPTTGTGAVPNTTIGRHPDAGTDVAGVGTVGVGTRGAGEPTAARPPRQPIFPNPSTGALPTAQEAWSSVRRTTTGAFTRPVVLGLAVTRRPAAVAAIRDAEGPALIITSDPTIWAETKDARAKLGPVLLYDPAHRCDTPARLHWSPSMGCEQRDTAKERSRALLAPIRPTAKIDTAVADAAETLLRSFLHAAAVDGRQFRHVHRWAQGKQIQDAVRILRSHPRAASGAAGELEAVLTAYPERRDIAQELTVRALSALSSVHIRDSCTPNRTDALSLDSFAKEGGTLYLVGEAIEDPKSHPGAMPLLTALASSVVEHGRRMAERSSSGRLDPPFRLVLDDVAAVAPLPQLPDLLTSGADRGMPTLALLRSREQARARWPHSDLPI